MNKECFIVWGEENLGKTHTVRYIAEKLLIIYLGKDFGNGNIAPLKITTEIL